MALFISRGFAAWRQAWTQAAPAYGEDQRRSTRSTESRDAIRLTNEVQMQMVSALAGMVLGALRGEAA